VRKIFNEASASSEILRQEVVGPTIGKELLSKAVVAAILAILVILCYVAYAFKNVMFGIAAVISLVHDLLVMLGCFSLFGHFFGVEVDTLFVTAFLTTMSFSVHDTIIILDRVREHQRRGTSASLEELSDRALTETMGRSLTNSLTIIIMLIALVLMGGATVKWFAVGLLIGTVSGTYSSPFIATPALLLMNTFIKSKRSHK
jgi:preprotein translocase subunit SecF